MTPPVRPGDVVVLIGGDALALRRVAAVEPDFPRDRCRVRFVPSTPHTTCRTPEQPLGDLLDEIRDGLDQFVSLPPRTPSRVQQSLSRLLAPDSDLAMRLRGLSVRDSDTGNLFAALGAVRLPGESGLEMHAARLRTAPFGSSAAPPPGNLIERHEEWEMRGEEPRILFVEAVSNDILPGSWVAFESPAGKVPPPRRVLSANVVVRVGYGITTRCTRLELDGPWFHSSQGFDYIRTLTVHAGTAGVALNEDDDPAPLADTDEIELDGMVGELPPGRLLIVEGELAAHPGARMGEVVMLVSSRHLLSGSGRPQTVLRVTASLGYAYRRESVVIWGNVGRATEGETVSELLAPVADAGGLVFPLSHQPLTYINAPTASGVASTLQFEVNGVAWQETENLALMGSEDRVFQFERSTDDTIRFGDGINGARLPTGSLFARYRTGLGAGGNCDAGQISQLMSRPAGVQGVINPRPASSGADPESVHAARRNIPAGVTALGRLVGARDYADFASAYAGIHKVEATLFESADGPAVLVTVAGPDDAAIPPGAELLRNLTDALEQLGEPSLTVLVLPATVLRVVLAAHVAVAPGYRWDHVAPRLRAALLDRFGFVRRELGQVLWSSEVIAAMQAVEGVADVHLQTLAALGDPVTTAMLSEVVECIGVKDVRARRGGLVRGAGLAAPRAAEIACLSADIPEVVVLTELGT